MTRRDIANEYFEWMCGLVDDPGRPRYISYEKLLRRLHETEFRYIMPRDENLAIWGMNLRYRFATTHGYGREGEIDGPCSVLEMMVDLAVRCEESIMNNPEIGDRTGQWFWEMIVNLGLGYMTDSRFDIDYVDDVLERFLDRRYEPDGRGGLFTIRNCGCDLRKVEIWYQFCWYLDTIT